MTYPAFKKLECIKEAIEAGDQRRAADLLRAIDPTALAGAARALFDFYADEVGMEAEAPTEAPAHQDGLLSDMDTRTPLPGVSLVSCCMNRNDNLASAVQSWLKLPVDEIVIVDWSSSHPVSETLADIDDERIKIVRIDDEPRWILTYGFNVGLRFASYSKVFKFDADITVSPDFLFENDFSRGEYIRGYWKHALDIGRDDQVHINGSFGAWKEDLRAIGYYKEFIRTYGWDDSDLYERLASDAGLKTRYLSLSAMLHMEQDQQSRIEHQKVIVGGFLETVSTTDFNILRNKFIGRHQEYWYPSMLQDYALAQVGDRVWQGRRMTVDRPIPDHVIADANSYAAEECIWSKKAYLIEGAGNPKALATLVYQDYANNIPFYDTESLLVARGSGNIHLVTNTEASFADYAAELAKRAAGDDVILLALGADYDRHTIKLGATPVQIIMLPWDMLTALSNKWSHDGRGTLAVKDARFISPDELLTFLVAHRPKIYVDAQHGLGNRLRAIASGAAIAKNTGRQLVIVWEPDHHCDCELSDLFDYDGPVLNRSFIRTAAEQGCDVYNYMTSEEGSEKDKPVVIGDNDIYIRTSCTAVCDHTSWDEENSFLRSLVPVKAVRDLIAPFDLDNYIAAHIRMEGGAGLDNLAYETPDNWTKEEHQVLNYWREKSSYSHFIKHIDRIFEAEPEAKLFLATDRKETYDIFRKYYGDRVTFLEREHFDRSKEQIVYALADAILLSKCKRLLGSTWSSFSEMAMRMTKGYSSIEMSGKDF